MEFDFYRHQTGGCGYHVPGPTRPGKMSKPLLSSRLRFWKPCSGNSGDCHVWKLVTDPSPPHSADGSPAANIWPGGFSAARLWKAPLDGPECRGSDDNCSPSALTYHLSLSLSLLSTDYYCLSPCCHTLRRCSITVRTLCLCGDEWDHDPPAVTTRNSYDEK